MRDCPHPSHRVSGDRAELEGSHWENGLGAAPSYLFSLLPSCCEVSNYSHDMHLTTDYGDHGLTMGHSKSFSPEFYVVTPTPKAHPVYCLSKST